MTTKEELQNLTYDQHKAALIKAVELRGNQFVYPKEERDGNSCMYTREVEGKRVGSCIVGVALIDVLGLEADDYLIESHAPADSLLSNLGVSNRAVLTMYSEAQYTQDLEGTWGGARDSGIEAGDYIVARERNND